MTANLKAEFRVKILFSKIWIDHQCLILFLKYALQEQKQFHNNALCQNEVKSAVQSTPGYAPFWKTLIDDEKSNYLWARKN